MFKKLFIPSDDSDLTSMALLVARLWFGLAMLFNHGLDKFAHFKDIVGTFPDPLGIGQEASLVLVVFAEVLGSLLLAVRWSSCASSAPEGKKPVITEVAAFEGGFRPHPPGARNPIPADLR